MSRLIAVEYLSLDGVMQAPGHPAEDPDGGFGQGGWTRPFMDGHGRYNSVLFQAAGLFLLGRRSCQILALYWPTVTDDSDEIARALNTKPKYVASTTVKEAAWRERHSSRATCPPRSRRSRSPRVSRFC